MATSGIVNLTANGSTEWTLYPGGIPGLAAHGTWGSGTLQLQWSLDNGTTVKDFTSGSLTADGYLGDLSPIVGPVYVRATLSGATDPDLYVTCGCISRMTGAMV